jgi:CRISPR-associated protein Csb2
MWHTITPAALPEEARRRRIDPSRRIEEAKAGQERMEEEERARRSVVGHSAMPGFGKGCRGYVSSGSPFFRKGERAEAFAAGTRFEKERLWHAEITFRRPTTGPIVIGDGRFMGLGLLAPMRQDERAVAPDSGEEGK